MSEMVEHVAQAIASAQGDAYAEYMSEFNGYARAAVTELSSQLLQKLERIDEQLADRYSRARDRGDESDMDAIASERNGLQTAIRIVKEGSAP